MKRIFRRGPWKALLLALFIGLVFGIGEVGEPLERVIQVARNKLRSHPGSGTIVLVAIDDRSLHEIGSTPWNGAHFADLIRRIDQAGARRIHLDFDLRNTGSADKARTWKRPWLERAEKYCSRRDSRSTLCRARNRTASRPIVSRVMRDW